MRCIDADKLHFSPRFAWATPDRESMVPVLAVDKEWVDKAPTIDAVPVVRCKDCVHYEMEACLKIYEDGAVSSYAWQLRNPDDFCSYGERKEDKPDG